MWALCRFAAEWKNPEHIGFAEQHSHSGTKMFFQSEIDCRANGQSVNDPREAMDLARARRDR
jgi:hypothetical protein